MMRCGNQCTSVSCVETRNTARGGPCTQVSSQDGGNKMKQKEKQGTPNLLTPVANVKIVPRDSLKPNDYNPNVVNKQNLDLLIQSIQSNGWTLPIVVRPDMTIIGGFHRWTVAGMEPLKTQLGGMVPVVIVEHKDHEGDIFGTITHNRARGTHLLEPMRKIVAELVDAGKTVPEISKQLGMKPEEIFRLSNFSREDFLKIMTKNSKGYSEAVAFRRL